MLRNIVKVTLLSLLVSLLPSSFQSANAVDILWNPGVSNDISSPPSLVPGAGIRNTGLLVNKSNPDELIIKIIMIDTFEDKPFSGKGRNLGMWIYWPTNYCWSKDKANCEGLFTVAEPSNPSSYPSVKSSEYVFVEKHNKESNIGKTVTACKAPWWIEGTYKSRDTWAFAVSITCLGIPKEFGWYGYSSIDLGQKDIVSDFTQVQMIAYPFWELAANAAAKNKESSSSANGNTQICVQAFTGQGYDDAVNFDEQCSGSNSKWEFTYCDTHPKADLQLYKNKKWTKIKTFKGLKKDCDDPESPNSFIVSGSLLGKYRMKNYGNTKFSTGYLDLTIFRKVIA
jgi:hypothetical protein